MKNPLWHKEIPERTRRGGSWRHNKWGSRVSFPNWNYASYPFKEQGFRLYRSKEKS